MPTANIYQPTCHDHTELLHRVGDHDRRLSNIEERQRILENTIAGLKGTVRGAAFAGSAFGTIIVLVVSIVLKLM
jgi:hypothetical protein